MSVSFSRKMDVSVYERYKDCIKKLAAKVRESDESIPILFSSDDTQIRLYVNGYVLKLQFYKRSSSFRLQYSEKLLKDCEFGRETPIELFDAFLSQLSEIIEEVYEYSKSQSSQKERKIATGLIAAMQKGKNNIMAVDMEVTVSNSNRYNCIARKNKTEPSNPEMDLLLIIKREGKHCFLPVEIKLNTGKTLNEGPAEVASSVNIFSENNIKLAFRQTYFKNCERYKELGVSEFSVNGDKAETFDHDNNWCSGVIVIINDTQTKPEISEKWLDDAAMKRLDLTKCPNRDQYKIRKIMINSKDFIKGQWVNDL